MNNKERFFLKSWKKKREKGKVRYILINTILSMILYWGAHIIIEVTIGKKFYNWGYSLTEIAASLIVFFVVINIAWHMNEKKYNKLVKSK